MVLECSGFVGGITVDKGDVGMDGAVDFFEVSERECRKDKAHFDNRFLVLLSLLFLFPLGLPVTVGSFSLIYRCCSGSSIWMVVDSIAERFTPTVAFALG